MTHKPTRHLISPIAFCSLAILLACVWAIPAFAITIPTVPVDGANTADTTGYGAVAYNYRIGTTEVTNSQYAAFLNAKAGTDPLDLYNTNMGNLSIGHGGITRTGSGTLADPYTYATIVGRANMPVNYVSWYDAIRFTNWLNNGQGNADTETGAYTLLGATATPSNGLSITRNSGATWFLTSEDEWYKGAYYDPSGSSYFDYPTADNAAPVAENPPGGGNSANYSYVVGDFIAAGSYTYSASPYGTFDQGGNAWEWNETLDSGSFRGLRGGSFYDNAVYLSSSGRFDSGPTLRVRYHRIPRGNRPRASYGSARDDWLCVDAVVVEKAQVALCRSLRPQSEPLTICRPSAASPTDAPAGTMPSQNGKYRFTLFVYRLVQAHNLEVTRRVAA